MNPLVPRRRVTARVVRAVTAATALVACSATALAGPDWDLDYEVDAKQTATTAQIINAGPTPVLHISGRLSGYGLTGSDFVDMYQIEITSDTLVSISTAGGDLGGWSDFDTQLFLFRRKGGNGNNIRAVALKGNDNAAVDTLGSRIGEDANPNSNSVLLRKGVYFLAVAGAGSYAYDEDGNAIWESLGQNGQTISGNEVFLDNWTDGGAVGTYTIRLQSLAGGAIPAPGAIALLGLGVLGRRRRRR